MSVNVEKPLLMGCDQLSSDSPANTSGPTQHYRLRASPEWRAAELKRNRERNRRPHKDLIMMLGGKCSRCGLADIRGLQLDHIYGGGTLEQRSRGGNIQMYCFYRNNEQIARQKLQVLCASCNWIKRHENNEQPKQILTLGETKTQ